MSQKISNLSLKVKITVIFILIAFLPIVALGMVSNFSLTDANNKAIDGSTSSLLSVETKKLADLSATYAQSINEKFASFQSELQNLSRIFSLYYQNPYYIASTTKVNPSFSNTFFYGEINGLMNGSVTYYNTTDYVDYDHVGRNDFTDFGADFIGDGNLSIHGQVDSAIFGTYKGALVSSDSYVQISITFDNGSSANLNINSYYAGNTNEFSSGYIDQWSKTNADGLTGNLASLNTYLLSQNVNYIDPSFNVYDSSPAHIGSVSKGSCVALPGALSKCGRIEGVINGTVNGTYNGIVRGLISVNVTGSSNDRLSFLDPIISSYWKENQPTFSWIYMGVPNMGYLYQYPWNPNYHDGTEIYNGASYNCTTRPWYNQTFVGENAVSLAEKGKHTFWTSLAKDANTGAISINLGQVIYDKNGNMVGPLEFKMVIKQIRNQILNVNVGQTGYAFLVRPDGNNGKGELLVYPQLNTLSSDSVLFTNQTLLANSELDDSASILVNDMKTGSSGVIDITTSNGEAIVAYDPINSTGWGLAIVISKSEIVNPALQIGQQIGSSISAVQALFLLAFIIVFGIAIVVSLVLANSITKPIDELTTAADKISKGDFDIKIGNLEKTNELGNLARSFDRMSKSLTILMKKFENK